MMVRVRARITVCHAMSGAGSQRQTPISLLLGQAPAGQELVIFSVSEIICGRVLLVSAHVMPPSFIFMLHG